MKWNWFVRKGIFYFPAAPMGWVLVAAVVVFAVYSFIDIDGRSHSGSDTLINFMFTMLIVAVFYSVIGFLTEKK